MEDNLTSGRVRGSSETGEGHGQTRSDRRRIGRVGLVLLLLAGALYYLQFGLQALAHYPPQGVLALLGAVALGWGAVRAARAKPASWLAFWGTMPLLLLHIGMTLEDPGELPFLVGSAAAPLAAGAVWLVARLRAA